MSSLEELTIFLHESIKLEKDSLQGITSLKKLKLDNSFYDSNGLKKEIAETSLHEDFFKDLHNLLVLDLSFFDWCSDIENPNLLKHLIILETVALKLKHVKYFPNEIVNHFDTIHIFIENGDV